MQHFKVYKEFSETIPDLSFDCHNHPEKPGPEEMEAERG